MLHLAHYFSNKMYTAVINTWLLLRHSCVDQNATTTDDLSSKETSFLPELSAVTLLYGGGASAATCGLSSESSSLVSCERKIN